MKKRITIDLTDEPAVFERIVTNAKQQRRSVGAQLLFEVLDLIRTKPQRPSAPKSAQPRRRPNYSPTHKAMSAHRAIPTNELSERIGHRDMLAKFLRNNRRKLRLVRAGRSDDPVLPVRIYRSLLPTKPFITVMNDGNTILKSRLLDWSITPF
jgi:hypothetical protein